ncbi:MAG: hypothetical protein ACRCWR_11820 [Saezia sp.]
MTAEVDICNLALSHLGDTATVASIFPPEGSAQAQHCAVFYPIARNTLLEAHDWGFATVRISPPAKLHENYFGWRYAYMRPADAIRIISVTEPRGTNSDQSDIPYVLESDVDGKRLILCNTESIVVKYIRLETNVSKYPPLFIQALSWHLAAMLAGPIIKGDAGAAEAKRCMMMAQSSLEMAAVSDASQQNHKPEQVVAWIKDR